MNLSLKKGDFGWARMYSDHIAKHMAIVEKRRLTPQETNEYVEKHKLPDLYKVPIPSVKVVKNPYVGRYTSRFKAIYTLIQDLRAKKIVSVYVAGDRYENKKLVDLIVVLRELGAEIVAEKKPYSYVLKNDFVFDGFLDEAEKKETIKNLKNEGINVLARNCNILCKMCQLKDEGYNIEVVDRMYMIV